MRQHEYLRRMLAAFERGVITCEPGDLSAVRVSHDDSCGAFDGRPCDCDPDIEVTAVDASGRRQSFSIGNDGELIASEAN